MTDDLEISVELFGDPDEPDFRSEEPQREFQRVADRFEALGVNVNPLWSLQKSFPGGSWLTGEFLIPVAQAVGPALGVIAVAWMQGRAGRKVRVKFGDTEAEARTPEELKRILELVEEHKAKTAGLAKETKEEQP